MICHAYNCIFVHQRKCAGISIIRAFGLDPSIPDWHFMNDGALSAEYTLAPPGYFDEKSRRAFLRHFGKDFQLFGYSY